MNVAVRAKVSLADKAGAVALELESRVKAVPEPDGVKGLLLKFSVVVPAVAFLEV